jgi:PGF-CTERM protein
MTHNDTPSEGRWRRLFTALVAVLMVTSMAVGATAGAAAAATDGQAQPALQEDDDGSTGNETLDPADEVFVRENGDIILRYAGDSPTEDQSGAELTNTEYGLDVGQGIFYSLIVSDFEEAPNATGSATAQLSPGALNATGQLDAPRPEAIESMSVEIDGETTQENNQFDASAQLGINTQQAPSLRLVSSADVGLESRVGPDSFDASGNVSATTQTQLGQPMAMSFELTESDGSYTLDAAQDQTVREFQRDLWATEEDARQTINQRYAAVAQSLGGSASVTLESYSFTETSQQGVYRLDIEYTIEYQGIDEGIEQQAAAVLANSEQFDLSRSEASAIAANVTELEIERGAVDFKMESTSVAGSFDIQLENYNSALLAGIQTFESYEPQDTEVSFDQSQIENLRAQIEAQQEAGLVQTFSMSASLTQESSTTAAFDMSAQSRTQNWGAYVSELEARGIPVANQQYSLSAETQDDRIVADGSFTVEQEGLVDQAVGQFMNATEQQAGMDEDAEQVRNFIRAFQQAGFQKARTDITVTEGDVTIEAGAKFEDLAAFRDVLQQSGRIDLSISDVVGRNTDDGAVEQYVYASGAVSADAGESEVRGLAVVNESTSVNMPGSYDRSFPEMDTQRAYEYLNLEPPADGGDGSDGSDGGDGSDGSDGSDGTETGGQPGFGVAVAALALVAAALLARRRD